MKHFFTFILFNFVLWSTVFAKEHPVPNSVQKEMELSVWKVRASEEQEGTGFFIGKNQFVTSFNNVFNLLNDKNFLKSMVLSQEGSPLLGINKILSISPLHNLVILETKENVTHHLTLEKNAPQAQEKLFVSSYLIGDFQLTRKTGKDILYEDERLYISSYNFYTESTKEINGGLVWDEKGQIIGMASHPHSYWGKFKNS